MAITMAALTRLIALLICTSAVVEGMRGERDNSLTEPAGQSQQVFMEDAQKCLAKGGVCTLGSGCPPSLRHTSDVPLCGGQPDLECCTQMPVTEGMCTERGGECVDPVTCHNGPRDVLGVCPPGEVCCVWVN